LPTEPPISARATSSCVQAAEKKSNVASSTGIAKAGTGVIATTDLTYCLI
jgi:hypothetical protein